MAMSQLTRSLVFSVTLFTIGALLLSPPLRSPVVSAQSDSFRAVYDNDEVFNQLSGAARTLLELKFGKKDAKGALGNQSNTSPNFPAANKSGGPDGSVSAQPSTALANNFVNDPAADTRMSLIFERSFDNMQPDLELDGRGDDLHYSNHHAKIPQRH